MNRQLLIEDIDWKFPIINLKSAHVTRVTTADLTKFPIKLTAHKKIQHSEFYKSSQKKQTYTEIHRCHTWDISRFSGHAHDCGPTGGQKIGHAHKLGQKTAHKANTLNLNLNLTLTKPTSSSLQQYFQSTRLTEI